jgi:nitrate/TMAO reductase-like tetraheme cytochrome c subunit
VAGQFNHDCTQCHSQNAWQPATFNHANTKFPLTGVHTTTACVSCHTNGNYQLQYTICYPADEPEPRAGELQS